MIIDIIIKMFDILVIIVLILKYFSYFIANVLQHFNLCKLRAKRDCWDNVTNCPTKKASDILPLAMLCLEHYCLKRTFRPLMM